MLTTPSTPQKSNTLYPKAVLLATLMQKNREIKAKHVTGWLIQITGSILFSMLLLCAGIAYTAKVYASYSGKIRTPEQLTTSVVNGDSGATGWFAFADTPELSEDSDDFKEFANNNAEAYTNLLKASEQAHTLLQKSVYAALARNLQNRIEVPLFKLYHSWKSFLS